MGVRREDIWCLMKEKIGGALSYKPPSFYENNRPESIWRGSADLLEKVFSFSLI
jgi:hypothetical protein